MTEATTPLRNTKKKCWLEKTTKMYFTVILRAILHKEDIEKEWKKFWPKSTRFDTMSQRLADQVRMILQKVWFSNLKIQEICGQINSENLNKIPQSDSEYWKARAS